MPMIQSHARVMVPRVVMLVLTFIFCQGPAAVVFAQGDAYKPPRTPKLLDPAAPSFAPLDAEVDSFVRIPQARAKFKVTGKGLAVVVIDTGVNPRHISFQDQLLPGKNFSTQGAADDTTDFDGHGSNVAGIIAAKAVPPNEGMPTGIAPDAKIIPLKVFPGGQFDKLNAALQWVLDNIDGYKTKFGVTISAVNMSLGSSENLQDLSTVTAQVLKDQQGLIAQLRAKNIVVTVAAGNDYFSFNPAQGMGFPGICPETVSVGAVYDTNIGPNADGTPLVTYVDGAEVRQAVAGRCTVFSQRLGAGNDGASPFRTDIFSPGFIVTSMGPVPPAGSGQDPTRTRTTDDGTSQATPVTAGVALLMQNHWRDLHASAAGDPGLPSVDFIEQGMRGGGVPFQDVDNSLSQAIGNVKASGGSYIRLDAIGALTAVDPSAARSSLRTLQMDLLRAKPHEQSAVLQRAGISVKP
jgi:hypothetical protein